MRRVLSETDIREFRDRACSVATELLATQEYDGFNMRELAVRLGVSAMTTYRYFASKGEIFTALRIQAFNRLADRLEQFLDLSGLPLERFAGVCRVYMDFAREEPVRYRLMFDHSPQIFVRSAELAGAQGRVFQALLDQTGSFASNGHGENPREKFARNLWASLHGLATLTAMGTLGNTETNDLLRDLARRFAGSSDSHLEFGSVESVTERQSNGTRRTNGAATMGWLSLTAAE